jgi:YfiH family protein
MFNRTRRHSIEYYESSLLSGCDFLTHAFCTRIGGVSEGDYKSLNISFKEGDLEGSVLQNWHRIALAFGIPIDNFLTLNQVHGYDIFVIKPYGDYYPEDGLLNYDAIVTSRDNLAICIKTADCVPLFIVDRTKKIIAAVHAGWKGTALEITSKVIRLLLEQYGSSPHDILATIGPSIGPCCFELDTLSAKAFMKHHHAKTFLFVSTKPNKWIVDLPEANRRQILHHGIPEENIEVARLCTCCRQDLFFSHRGSGGVTGRQVNFIMIRGDVPCRVLTVGNAYPTIQ